MLLQKLAEYGQRIEPTPTMYVLAPVRYLIELDGKGTLLSPEPIDTAEPGTRRASNGRELAVPAISKTSDIRASLLVGDAQYVLGVAKKGKDAARAARCHEAFVGL